MFEAAELGRSMSKAEYDAAVPALQTKLLELQRQLRAASFPVFVIVSGVEGAGKSEVVNRLHEWLDARGLRTVSFFDETDEMRERPAAWRFWREHPPRGTIGVFFGSWYTRPIVDHVYERIDEDAFERAMARITATEAMLVADGALIVKLWFHLSRKTQKKLAGHPRKATKSTWKVTPLARRYAKRTDVFRGVSERAIQRTDAPHAPWHVVEAEDRRYRDFTAATILCEALERRLAGPKPAVKPPAPAPAPPIRAERGQTVLDRVDLAARVEDDDYRRRLDALQRRVFELAWMAHGRGVSSLVLFEGWDAAGKGGAIRRLTSALDARLFRVVPIAAPTDEERAQHYLWRFWRHLPRAGNWAIYDRSWYGRVLVERVEGFAPEADWSRAYAEINDFEAQLTEHGIALTKVWLHIDKREQLRRFREREKTAWKAHKITAEDWRNREKWPAYAQAVHEMVVRTSTPGAPWTLVAGNDKRVARLQVLEAVADHLERSLDARGGRKRK